MDEKIQFDEISKKIINVIKNSKINKEHSLAELLSYIKNIGR